MKKVMFSFAVYVHLIFFSILGTASASTLYTIAGPQGGTIINGYYTEPPVVNVQFSPDYPQPCAAQGGTPIYNTDQLLKPLTMSLNGSFHWQIAEDTNNHALVLRELSTNWASVANPCLWNTPNPNYVVAWDKTIQYDTSGPSVAISSPGNNTNISDSTVLISGSVSDTASGIKSVTVNGSAATLNGGTFSVKLAVSVGLNTIVAEATDNVGHVTDSSSITIFRYENKSSAANPTNSVRSGNPKNDTSLTDGIKGNNVQSNSNAESLIGTDKKEQNLQDNTNLVRNVAKGTGVSLVALLTIGIGLLVLDRLGVIEIKLFSKYHHWRTKHYSKKHR